MQIALTLLIAALSAAPPRTPVPSHTSFADESQSWRRHPRGLSTPTELPAIMVVGDTQTLAELYPERYVQFGTLIADYATDLDIALIVHVGDFMNAAFSPMPPLPFIWHEGKEDEDSGDGGTMTNHGLTARAFVDEFRGLGVPWTLTLGNHDYDNDGFPAPHYFPNLANRSVSVVGLPEHLPMTLVNEEPWFVESMGDGTDQDDAYAYALTFDLAGETQLGIVLPMAPYVDMLEWALDVAARHAEKRVWIVTHAWLDGGDAFDATGAAPARQLSATAGHAHPQSNYMRNQTQHGGGQIGGGGSSWPMDSVLMWIGYFRHMPNLAFIFAGHNVNGPAAHRTDVGVHGNVVHQLLVNAQSSRNTLGRKTGGDGYMQLLSVDIGAGTVSVETVRALAEVVEESYDETFVLPLPEHVLAGVVGDLDGNGIIGLPDLLVMLSNWGPCGQCAADLDADGIVGFLDFTLLLSYW